MTDDFLGDRKKAEEFARRALQVAPNSKKAQEVLDELQKPSDPENL